VNRREDPRPNIVLINCDDLGYGDLGCYDSTVNSTPALDRMAAEGMRFTDFYMASPVCSPSRASMLTGCYPTRIGFGALGGLPVLFPGHELGLNPSEITIATLLRDAGYATKLVGKWHCGDQPEFLPTRHGFDSYFGLPYSNDMGRQHWPDHLPPLAELLKRRGLALPLEEYPPLPLMLDEEVIEAQPDQAALTERYLQESLRFIRENRARPFFLYFAHMYVHLPIYVQDRFLNESANGKYGAAVSCIDWATDVLLHELARLGLDSNTVVIFTSDNGALEREHGGSNLPLRGSKGTTWEGGQRVPCIIRGPGRVKTGRTCAEVTTAMDFYPTLASLAGTTIPADRVIDGRDISALLAAPAAPSPHEQFLFISRGSIEAVRAGRWKLHVRKGSEEVLELYDLEVDIGEAADVAGKHPGIIAELQERIDTARRDLGDEGLGLEGEGVRPIGRALTPQPLVTFDPGHPYYMAEYDLSDRG